MIPKKVFGQYSHTALPSTTLLSCKLIITDVHVIYVSILNKPKL